MKHYWSQLPAAPSQCYLSYIFIKWLIFYWKYTINKLVWICLDLEHLSLYRHTLSLQIKKKNNLNTLKRDWPPWSFDFKCLKQSHITHTHQTNFQIIPGPSPKVIFINRFTQTILSIQYSYGDLKYKIGIDSFSYTETI